MKYWEVRMVNGDTFKAATPVESWTKAEFIVGFD